MTNDNEVVVKRGRGRPRKTPIQETGVVKTEVKEAKLSKNGKKLGRPKKSITDSETGPVNKTAKHSASTREIYSKVNIAIHVESLQSDEFAPKIVAKYKNAKSKGKISDICASCLTPIAHGTRPTVCVNCYIQNRNSFHWLGHRGLPGYSITTESLLDE